MSKGKKAKDVSPISVEFLSPEERVDWFATCKAVESYLKKQLEALRPYLLEDAKTRKDEWGCFGHQVKRSVRPGKLPDEKALLDYLHEKGIDPSLVFDPTTMWVLNPSKLDHLIQVGKIPSADITHMYKEVEVLEVTPSDEIKSRVSGNMTKLLGEGSEDE